MDSDFNALVWSQLECSGSVERRVLERSCHTATLVGSYVYVIGGKRRSQFCGDVHRLNLETKTWEAVFPALPFLVRANHSAVAVGEDIWVIGGMSAKHVYQDVHILNTTTMEWSTPTLEGNTFLLKRCAHGCSTHPSDPNAILLFGGYGGKATAAGDYTFLNDLVVIHTDRKSIEVVKCTSAGELPGRAYHTLTSLGGRCYSIGGKSRTGVLDGVHFVQVYDPRTSRWLAAPRILGPAPTPRSSHRSVAVGSAILITGGVAAQADAGQRFEDVVGLIASESSNGTLKLSWSVVGGPERGPAARSAHAVLVHNKRVLILMGYRGKDVYMSDCWALQEPQTRHPVQDPCITPSPEPGKVTVFDASVLVSAPPTSSTKKPRLAALQLLGNFGRTPKARAAGLGTTGPSPASNKRPGLHLPEWHMVKRKKAQEAPEPARALPQEKTPVGTTSVYDLASEDPSQPANPNLMTPAKTPMPATSRSADAVYIKKIKELEEQVSRLHSASKDNRASESKLRTRCVALEAQVQDLSQDKERVQQLLTAASRELQSKEAQLGSLSESLKHAHEQLAKSQEELKASRQQLGAARQECAGVQRETATRQGELVKEMMDLKHQLAACTAASQQYQALADQRGKDSKTLRHQVSDLQQRLHDTSAQLASTTQEKQQLEGMLIEKDASLTSLRADTTSLRDELKQQCIAAERKSAEQTAALEHLKGEHTSLLSSHQKLQDTVNSMSRALETAQAELTKERKSRAAAAQVSAQEKEVLEKQLQEVNQKLAAAERELERLREYETSTRGQVASLQRDLEVSRGREAALEEQVLEATAEVTKLRGENYRMSRQVEIIRAAGSPLLGEAESLQTAFGTLLEKLREHHHTLNVDGPIALITNGPAI